MSSVGMGIGQWEVRISCRAADTGNGEWGSDLALQGAALASERGGCNPGGPM